jgi:hypothetical protein
LSVAEFVAAICERCPCFGHPYQVLSLRADFAAWLFAGFAALNARRGKAMEKLRRAPAAGHNADGDGQRTTRGDGTQVIAIKSMDTLRSFLSGGVGAHGRVP